jgi:hypothetical protein
MAPKSFSLFRQSLLIAAVVTFCCVVAYATMQQIVRRGADQLQVQLARDAAISGGWPAAGEGDVDIAKSLSPWVALFDDNGRCLTGAARLDGRLVAPPAGVFETARGNGEHRVTWQPRPGVRQALVIVRTKNGFAASGRSLAEAESQIHGMGQLITALWVAGSLGLVALNALTFGFSAAVFGRRPADAAA